MSDLYDVLRECNAHMVSLDRDSVIKPFTCENEARKSYGKHALDTFIQKYAKSLVQFRRCRINVIENSDEIIAYYSLAHDSLSIEVNNDDFFRELKEKICKIDSSFDIDNYCKTEKTFPAVKIEHLAVNVKYQDQGIGSNLIFAIIGDIISNTNWYGCQYLTVDVLNNSDTNKFYINNGFQYVTLKDHASDCRRMYLPLFDYFDS